MVETKDSTDESTGGSTDGSIDVGVSRQENKCHRHDVDDNHCNSSRASDVSDVSNESVKSNITCSNITCSNITCSTCSNCSNDNNGSSNTVSSGTSRKQPRSRHSDDDVQYDCAGKRLRNANGTIRRRSGRKRISFNPEDTKKRRKMIECQRKDNIRAAYDCLGGMLMCRGHSQTDILTNTLNYIVEINEKLKKIHLPSPHGPVSADRYIMDQVHATRGLSPQFRSNSVAPAPLPTHAHTTDPPFDTSAAFAMMAGAMNPISVYNQAPTFGLSGDSSTPETAETQAQVQLALYQAMMQTMIPAFFR